MNENIYAIFVTKKFFTLQVLRRHIDSHTGDRRFKCKFCDKAFRSSSERRRHEMIHTGEKPHHCEYCEKTFKSKYNRDVHVSAHRGEQPCYICGGKFLNAEVVNLHTKFKHKVKLDGTTVETNIERDDQ
ncbi:hypothetical protein NQ314_001147 [Rhamnusium bicolor]|uniref:C2H2-type domain-containing protein n=1 Tax=Rhamnusium bicolor TaxID=1586634 RepID=A0AAV8ZTM7_9CUCU|nr:hypothetical protein NQ314_001147 [Rhamnusium bicolor]